LFDAPDLDKFILVNCIFRADGVDISKDFSRIGLRLGWQA
jgi:hypothetical protein